LGKRPGFCLALFFFKCRFIHGCSDSRFAVL
jgi:hypothetical protein